MSGVLGLLVAGAGAPGIINGALPAGGAFASTATWRLNNDGTYTISGQSDANWVTPAASVIAAQYQVKVDVTLASFSTGTTGTWLDLSSTQTWTIDSAGDPESVTFDVSFREKATGIVRSTQTGLTLTADA